MGTAAQAGSSAPHLCRTHEGLPRANDGGVVTGKKAERTKNDGQEKRGEKQAGIAGEQTHLLQKQPWNSCAASHLGCSPTLRGDLTARYPQCRQPGRPGTGRAVG